CYNPFLYAWLNENFRKGIHDRFALLQVKSSGSKILSPGGLSAERQTNLAMVMRM
ncbi:hypothetical protein CEXT_804841, partial [Caerostris extrusa]